MRGDLLGADISDGSLDLVINCSTVEHVGLSGRYGETRNISDGDLDAMKKLYALMKPGAVMLMTIPVGQDAVFAPMTRVYGSERLPELVKGFSVTHEEYWVKDDANRWIQADKDTALAVQTRGQFPMPEENYYPLGCLVLKKT